MKITICGSMTHIKAIQETASTLTSLGYEVAIPNPREGEVDYNTLPNAERATLKETLIQEHLNEINESDAVLIFNEAKKGIAGYIGGNTLMEMAFAYAQRIEIFLFNQAPDMGYTDEILGMQPIILDGNVHNLDKYFKELPTTFISSKSPIKLTAISRGMRRAGIKTRVISYPTKSGVSEQPMTTKETYQGALNRHENLVTELRKKKEGHYFVTVESGQNVVHPDHNTFGGSVVIIEKKDAERKVGININIEYPKSMTDKVPSMYPDLGVLVQEEYGSKLKDPVPFITNGKINRRKLIEEAVFNVAVQLNDN